MWSAELWALLWGLLLLLHQDDRDDVHVLLDRRLVDVVEHCLENRREEVVSRMSFLSPQDEYSPGDGNRGSRGTPGRTRW